MADIVLQKNVASYLSTKVAAVFTSATAGGAGDNTSVNGVDIDRAAFNMPMTAKVSIIATATLAANKALQLQGFKIQTAPDSGSNTAGTYVDYYTYLQAAGASAFPVAVLTDSGSGGTQQGALSFGVDLNMANRWVRVVYTPDLTNTATDTSITTAVVDFAGMSPVPAL